MTPEEPNRKAAFGGATFFVLDGLFLCSTQSGWRHWCGVLTILLGIIAYAILLWQVLHQAQKKADNSPRTAATSPHTFTPDPPVQPLTIAPARTLTPAEQEKLRALIAILHQAGIFAPEAPAATDLAAAVADWGEVELEAVLSAILETAYYHPEFQESRYNANLAYIETDCERDESSLRDEIDDLLRLAACPHASYSLHCDETNHHANGFMLHLHMTHGEHTLNLSGIARFLYESGAPRRLICYWEDTLWLSSLPATDPQALAYLNQQLGLDAESAWRYLDDESQ